MTSKTIPIKINREYMAKIEELSEILGHKDCWGAIPKTLRFCVAFALAHLKSPDKLYLNLSELEFMLYQSSILKVQKREKLLAEAERLAKEARNV